MKMISNINCSRGGEIFALLLMAVCLLSLACPAPLQAAADNIQINYKDQLLTLKAQDADIKNILLKISDLAGIYVRFPQAIEKQITIELDKVPLAKALKKLLRGLNHAIIYSISDKKNRAHVASVYVMQKSKGVSTGSFSSINSQKESIITRRIQHYEKTIQSLNERLSKVDSNSPLGQRYTRQIQTYQKSLDSLR